MRQASSLFDRLDRRFTRMESLGQASVRGYERLDRFIKNFQARMKKLESMSKFRELALFKRMPSFASNDPWGSMGGWSFAKDFVYLEGIPEEEEIVEDAQAPRVSPWGTADKASGNKDLRVSSPWLNTPFRPARVSRGRGASVQSSARKVSPLQRVLNKAAVSEFYDSDKKQVQESLPPMLARSSRVTEKLMKAEKRERFVPQVSSAKKMRTPKRVIDQVNSNSRFSSSRNRIQASQPSVSDYQVLVQQLVQDIQNPQNSDKITVQKLKKRVQKIKKEIQRVERGTSLQSLLNTITVKRLLRCCTKKLILTP